MKAKEYATDRLMLPRDVFFGAMNISLTGAYQAYVENYCSIIEYTDKVIKLKGKECCVRFAGSNLLIDKYTKTDMYIVGKIKEVTYY